jgi:hypothetical protein
LRPARFGSTSKTRQALVDIGDEPRLAEFAVVDDVDAAFRLLAHDNIDSLRQPRLIGGGVNRFSVLHRLSHGEEIGGAREAAGVGGENAIGAAFHGRLAGGLEEREGSQRRPDWYRAAADARAIKMGSADLGSADLGCVSRLLSRADTRTRS